MLSRWVIGVGGAVLVGFLAAGCGRSSGREDEGAVGDDPTSTAPENAGDTQAGNSLPTGEPNGTGSDPGGTGAGGDEGGTGTGDEGSGMGTGEGGTGTGGEPGGGEGGTPSACTEEGIWVATHDGDDDDDDCDDDGDDCDRDVYRATSCGEITSAEEINSVLVRLPCFHMLERVTVTDLEGCRPTPAGQFGSLGICAPDSWGVAFAGLASHRIKVCVGTSWPINPDALSIQIRAGESCRTELEATASCYLGSGDDDD